MLELHARAAVWIGRAPAVSALTRLTVLGRCTCAREASGPTPPKGNSSTICFLIARPFHVHHLLHLEAVTGCRNVAAAS